MNFVSEISPGICFIKPLLGNLGEIVTDNNDGSKNVSVNSAGPIFAKSGQIARIIQWHLARYLSSLFNMLRSVLDVKFYLCVPVHVLHIFWDLEIFLIT